MRCTVTQSLEIIIALTPDEARRLEKKPLECRVFSGSTEKTRVFLARGGTKDDYFELFTQSEEGMQDATEFRITISDYGYQLLRQKRYVGDRRTYGWARINVYIE